MYRDQREDRIGGVLDRALAPHQFAPRAIGDELQFRRYRFGAVDSDGTDIVPIRGAWCRTGWLAGNIAVVHLAVPDDGLDQIGALSARAELDLAPRIGCSWWNPLGLHLVWSGERMRNRTGNLDTVLEPMMVEKRDRLGRTSTQVRADPTCNLLSVFVVDVGTRRVASQARRGLRTSKPIYTAISAALGGLFG